MKRFVSVLLFVLLVLSLAGCMSVRMPVDLHGQANTEANALSTQAPDETPADVPEDAPEALPGETPQEDPADEPQEDPVGEPQESPADAPQDGPETVPEHDPENAPVAGTPFGEAIANASKQLADVQSLHMDMQLNAAKVMTFLGFQMDLIKDPFLARMELSSSAMGERMALQLYAAGEGDTTVLYASTDEGMTWEKQTGGTLGQLPQAPAETIALFLDLDEADLEQTGTEEVDGLPVVVYAGEVDGERVKDILYSTGIIEALGSAMGTDVPEASLLDLGDAEVTFMFDAQSGLPVRFSMDMTEVVTNLLKALLGQSLTGEDGEDLSMHMVIPAMVLEITLSQFDSVEPIVIPEAALAVPEV